MKKTLLLTLASVALGASLMAKPAKRVHTSLTQPDGTQIEALFEGDELGSYYTTLDHQLLMQDASGFWKVMDAQSLLLETQRRNSLKAAYQAPAEVRKVPSLGEHHFLTLLVEFPDLRFSELGDKAHFEDMLNGDNYTTQGATGSARQYFKDQSMEKFQPTFDVVGPIMADSSYVYYGKNVGSSTNANIRTLIKEAIEKAIAQGLIDDCAPYDNDGDGYVDLVYVFYAGYSESERAGDDYIWPHKWTLSTPIVHSDKKFSLYACSSELMGKPTDPSLVLDGIGTCVHEFSHCLGLPDFYNTGSKTGCYGMDVWSVMDQGCYNGNGLTPSGYSAFERYSVHWLDFDELPTSGTVDLEPLNESNRAYIYRNPNNEDEFFTFENRQLSGWDSYFGTFKYNGLFICHVDYAAGPWSNNSVNNDPLHQRYIPVATNDVLTPYDQVQSNADYQKYLYNLGQCVWPGADKVDTLSRAKQPQLTTFFTGDSLDIALTHIYNKSGMVGFQVQSFEETGLLPTFADGDASTTTLYDLTGHCLAKGIDPRTLRTLTLQPGIYVLQRGQEIQKIIIQ